MIPRKLLLACIAFALLSGCISEPIQPAHRATEVRPEVPGESGPTFVNKTDHFAYDTTFHASILMCALAGPAPACEFLPLGGSGGWAQIPPANYTHAIVNLTWSATSPSTERLELSLWYDPGNEESLNLCEKNATATGPSRLKLECSLKPHDPKADLYVTFIPSNMAPDPFWGWANLDQPAHFDLALTRTEPS